MVRWYGAGERPAKVACKAKGEMIELSCKS